MPRVRYKPFSWYEEAVGLRNAKRIAYGVYFFGGTGFLLFVGMVARTSGDPARYESHEGLEGGRAKVEKVVAAEERMIKVLRGEEQWVSVARKDNRTGGTGGGGPSLPGF